MPQLSAKTQELVLRFCTDVLTEHKKHEDYYLKMEAIDEAFARYIASRDPKTGEVQGEGIDAATVHTGVFNVPSTVPPIVVSQVESMVGYLSEVFLSGSPLFPIVSNPANSQTLIGDVCLTGGSSGLLQCGHVIRRSCLYSKF
jgi:hypothetical protein